MVLTAFAFFTVGFSLKIALFPLHTWLPGAYTYAPTVVSSIMAATATKVGAYIMLRIMFGVFKVEFDLRIVPVTMIFIVISSAAIILTSVYAIAQTNLKRMLAYSSVGQIGYIVLGASMNDPTAMTGGIVHILNHALVKGALFMVAGCIVYKTGVEDISGLRGLGKKMPFTMALFTIAGISMMGFPLTVGFISKWYISIGMLNAGMGYLVPVIIISSLLTAVYFWRIIVSIYFSQESPEHGTQETEGTYSEAPWTMIAPAMVLVGLGIFFGTFATVPLSIAKKAAIMLLH
jgi:multicomponent Na+:H+ antiporter subunit D